MCLTEFFSSQSSPVSLEHDHFSPTHHPPPFFKILLALVLVFQVVRMFPQVHYQKRVQAHGQRRVLECQLSIDTSPTNTAYDEIQHQCGIYKHADSYKNLHEFWDKPFLKRFYATFVIITTTHRYKVGTEYKHTTQHHWKCI